jgi:hypothetical protein
MQTFKESTQKADCEPILFAPLRRQTGSGVCPFGPDVAFVFPVPKWSAGLLAGN